MGIANKNPTLTHCRPAMPFGKKNILEDLISSVLSQFKQYHPSGNLKYNYLGIFQSLKLRILMEKTLRTSLKLNFPPNTLGCYGLISPRVGTQSIPKHILPCKS